MKIYRLELFGTVYASPYFDESCLSNYRRSPYYMIFNENHPAKINNTLQIYISIVKYQHPSLINYPLQLGYQE